MRPATDSSIEADAHDADADSRSDVGFDTGPDAVLDVGVDASPDAHACDHELGTLSCWSTFSVERVLSGLKGFSGAAFDGRNLYLAPLTKDGLPTSLAARYDTTGPAGFAAGSWSLFDISGGTSSYGRDYGGATFDGRYVYYAPLVDEGGVAQGVAERYDTTSAAGFGGSTSWEAFDLSAVSPDARGFSGAAFDGRYVYYVPLSAGGTTFDGLITRFDTTATAGFATSASWETFDLTTVDPKAKGFDGAAFDGRFLYFASTTAIVARFDTSVPSGLASPGAWEIFDVTTASASASGFGGAVFDGRHVYLVPSGGKSGAIAARYDVTSTSGFGGTTSWETFDVSTLVAGGRFAGAVFDGRWIYLVPNGADAATFDSVAARFDTTSVAGFASASAWQTFDVTASLGTPHSCPCVDEFRGGAFDGRYVYFVPNYYGIVARFEARDAPATIPKLPGWFPWGPGSFF